ncbi:MAG: GNAT family N-acetyltransferase [Candidatus Zixiibacteriota bacterium]
MEGNIHYTGSVDRLNAEQLSGFFVGWPDGPSPQTHLLLLQQSSYIELARVGRYGRVVGFTTAVSDGVICAYIPLLEVLPDYQGRGIGRTLVERMLERLSHIYMIDLVCDQDLQGFYQKLGMQTAHAMIIRNFDYQAGRA